MSNKMVTIPIPEPTLGYITFMSYDPMWRFTARLGDGTPNPTGGYGGWTVTERQRRRALTEWTGEGAYTLDIPILFDNWIVGESIEDDILSLERMAGWGIGQEPPLLAFNSGGVVPHDQHDAPTHDWVISDLQWGDADRNKYGNRVRQAVTVTVMLYVEDDTLSDQSAAERRRAAKNNEKNKGRIPRNKLYIVSAADIKHGGLSYIAQKKLGDHRRWREIARIQVPRIRDPKKLKLHQHLRLP